MPSEDLLQLARQFHHRLTAARAASKTAFEWYPYDSLANAQHLVDLLGPQAAERMSELVGGNAVLDIGCGDGDLSFFLEGLGYEVHAIDNPVTNHNGMRGINTLKERLGSRILAASVDLDQQFRLPGADYGLAICFGVLYHLKNPYYLLEKLARTCKHMLLSTRVTSSIPGVSEPVGHIGVAYFLKPDELNEDNSNYWILTNECLLRMLQRTHWTVEGSRKYRLSGHSDPVSIENDERIFLLLRSCYGTSEVELAYGWHQPENEGWRWTERKFGVRALGANAGPSKITLKLYVPDQIVDSYGSVVLEGFVDGQSLGAETIRQAGDYTYVRPLPQSGDWQIDFEVGRAIAPDDQDARERALIVAGCELERS